MNKNETLALDPSQQLPENAARHGAPPAFGGWLYLPAVGLGLGILLSVFNLFVALSYAGDIPSRYSEIFTVTLLAEFGFLAFIVYVATRFYGRRRNAPAMMIAALAGGVALYLALLIFALAADAEPFAVASGQLLVRNIIGAAIWIPYFTMSKRVRDTFVVP